MKIIILGGAGLVGQNLIVRLKSKGYSDITVIDKHRSNVATLRTLQPDITVEYSDLAEAGSWIRHFQSADCAVMLQAQIGGNNYQDFVRNNIDSTRQILEAIKIHHVRKLIHVSSSVVESAADDLYTRTKRTQEELVLNSGVYCTVLRPTLMFGWFDRKHLGWLSRFMKRVPVFPIPGHGRYIRQPLYVGDFCNIIVSCIESNSFQGIYNVSGLEKIYYVDIIREIRRAIKAKTLIIHIPYWLFYFLLKLWARLDKNPPFTTQQLSALIAKDEFVVIDWPALFGVQNTSFIRAINETFNDSKYSKVTLDF